MSDMDDKGISMTFLALRNRFEQDLHGHYEVAEIRQHFASLCERYFSYTPAQLVLVLKDEVPTDVVNVLLNDLSALTTGTPIQYILGCVHFLDVFLELNNAVLIPRPETEELVHWMLSSTQENETLNVVDIGTGSGCIALAFKKARPKCEVSGWDIDAAALAIAQKNADENQLPVQFKELDVLTDKLPKTKWDIIVSNPPYVPEKLKKSTQPHVLHHEPQHAIFVSDDTPLVFYERIIAYATGHLVPSGMLYFEGHTPLMESLKSLLQEAGFSDIVLRKDFRENLRFIRAKK